MQAKNWPLGQRPEQTACMGLPVRCVGDIGLFDDPRGPQPRLTLLLSSQVGFQGHQDGHVGAYRAFFDLGVQADWVHDQDIEKYDVIYALTRLWMPAELLVDWPNGVADGGAD